MNVKSVFSFWTGMSLIKRIVIGLIVGVLLGIFAPADVYAITMLGKLFVGALKAVAPLLVFFLIISALDRAKAAGSIRTILVLYIISTLCAALIAACASYLFPMDLTLASPPDSVSSSPSNIGDVFTTLLMNIVANPVDALMNANYIGILAWAIVLGIALRAASENTKDVFNAVSDAINKIVRWVIACAPFGICGLVYTSVSDNGLDIFVTYGELILVLVGCMLIMALIINPIIVASCIHRNPYPLVLRCLKDSGITAFFTRSSAANIPVNMRLAGKLGLDRDAYSVSIPLGATINMAGAAVTITVMSMAAAHTLGISIDFPTAVILCLLAAVSAAGSSGVAGGSLLLIPLCCSLFGISNDVAMQVVGIGFIIGVIQDSCETALNSSSDVLFTATAEYMLRRKHHIPFAPGKDAPEPEQIIEEDALHITKPMPSDETETVETNIPAADVSAPSGAAPHDDGKVTP